MENVHETGSQTGIEPTEVDSHIDEPQDGTAVAEIASARALFGLPEIETPQEPDDQPADDADLDDDDATQDEDVEEQPRDKNGRYVKYNKEDRFVPEDEYDPLLRKGLNYEKVEGRAKTYESALDRVAKLQGYKDHADLLANIDTMEEQRLQQEKNQFDQLTEHLRQSAYEAGIDPEALDQWLDNHPLIKEAKEAASYRETERQRQAEEAQKQQEVEGWQKLFAKYPSLSEQIEEDEAGNTTAPFLNEEMLSRIKRGYDPLDAYELANRGNLAQEAKKKTEQQILKQQRLNKRASVETAAAAKQEPEASKELTDAFALFGLPPEAAKKYAK